LGARAQVARDRGGAVVVGLDVAEGVVGGRGGAEGSARGVGVDVATGEAVQGGRPDRAGVGVGGHGRRAGAVSDRQVAARLGLVGVRIDQGGAVLYVGGTATADACPLSLHDALPISLGARAQVARDRGGAVVVGLDVAEGVVGGRGGAEGSA